ncbi:beta-glucanase, partial [Streptomyces sp. NPDC001356]
MEEHAPDGRLPAPRRPAGSDVVFTADFASPTQWVAGRSWAYPDGGPVNPDDDKLDYLVTDADHSRSGVFRATRRPDGRWD